ncbi:dihydrofolate reductase family protein [Chryseolinea lacunae]|uniref:Dihydrofolate reductase n=1 Tax=Chryseolinea lacunae TaxID=2801331 RepID=A0ABS1KLT2_9BACT|nr:dihydrofolate reductase family protein [Chryseolinea lacunae]MBL0740401.1 dihydrofolate reductase [Chryseolinea lacunae]
MRKTIALLHTTLDGFLAGPNGEMDWIQYDEEIQDHVAAKMHGIDTVFYGRVTYDMMVDFWPAEANNPDATPYHREHARWIGETTKIVFTKTMKEATWQNTVLIHDNIPKEVERLKALPGKDMLIIGSASIARFFLQKGLLDELWLNINPVILGKGIDLYKDLPQKINLTCLEAKKFACGVVGYCYRVER